MSGQRGWHVCNKDVEIIPALGWLDGFLACVLCGGPYMSSMKWTVGSARLYSGRRGHPY